MGDSGCTRIAHESEYEMEDMGAREIVSRWCVHIWGVKIGNLSFIA